MADITNPKPAQHTNDGDLSGGRGDGVPMRDGLDTKEVARNPREYFGQTRPRCYDAND